MKGNRLIGIAAAVGAAIVAMAASSQGVAAATLPGYCSAEGDGGDLSRVVSGTTVAIECHLQVDERTPYWMVLETDGDPAAWTVQRRDAEGNIVSEQSFASPEVILPVGDYVVRLDAQVPSVVEVLTRESGLREEVARAQTKALFTAEVRAAPSGTNVLDPKVGDLTQRIATLVDVRSEVVHPFYASAENALAETRVMTEALLAMHDPEWAGAVPLNRDLERMTAALAAGQLDRVSEQARILQRFVEGETAAAETIGSLDQGRMAAIRATVVIGGIALVALAVAGAAVYILLRRSNWFGSDDVYEAVA